MKPGDIVEVRMIAHTHRYWDDTNTKWVKGVLIERSDKLFGIGGFDVWVVLVEGKIKESPVGHGDVRPYSEKDV
jgi:hypothetical protein